MPRRSRTLLADTAKSVLEQVKDRIKMKLKNGHPYATVSIKRIRRKFDGKNQIGVKFVIEKLRREYNVRKDRNWLIVAEKKEKG